MLIQTEPKLLFQPLRDVITNAYRMDETICIERLLPEAELAESSHAKIQTIARNLITEARAYQKRQKKIDALLHQYDLSTDEGIALMCLAEALLRIPDKATMDSLISDKLSTTDWGQQLAEHQSFLMNAATWSLLITGKIYAPTLDRQKTLLSALKRVGSRLGATVLRPLILQMMKAIGRQFVLGETIAQALEEAKPLMAMGYRFSFDMLGEAARTEAEAKRYYQVYQEAIDVIGKSANGTLVEQNPGISIKLSALYPRYELAQYDDVMTTVKPRLLRLAQLAKQYHIGLTVDAEEADRLDLSLDLIEQVFTDPSLDHWEGFGLALQAYQKRARFVIDWLTALAKQQRKRIMVRLIKGAYWDAEIKISQVQGLDYPVFTRKYATDVSYLACAKQLLAHPACFYPQFGTHNAYTAATLLTLTEANTAFEFQCLQGMGRALYDPIVAVEPYHKPCRIYAPVGTHEHLLGYLVRRLLENGANSSFINHLANDDISLEKLTVDPVQYISHLSSKPHPRIPTYRTIYGAWQNSAGIDLSNRLALSTLKKQLDKTDRTSWQAASVIQGKLAQGKTVCQIKSPSDQTHVVGEVREAEIEMVDTAIRAAEHGAARWANTPVAERAAILERAADLLQQAMPEFITLLVREAGKCIPDCLSEIRETIDYCRYYAYRARLDLAPVTLPSPTGELNELSFHPRGIVVCISPWNFPLAIFSGQLLAALVTGNRVIAKPAEQTPLIAFRMVKLLHQAGIPVEALQLLLGKGSVIGNPLVSDPRVAVVMFTGSTETAKIIEQNLARRQGPIGQLIAETGGQNAMIVDSSALPEQAVVDIAQSAFNSAGQRCSALRVLFVQEEIAPTLIGLLKGYLAELKVGDPSLLSTDIGPVIDQEALHQLQTHYAYLQTKGQLLAQAHLQAGIKSGFFFTPSIFEISDLSLLKGEVFGPILHIIKYNASHLDHVLDAIKQTGYGLTLGIHSRIDATIRHITDQMPVGNLYVNRNMIGAVVGVQPFGGEGLSGTGPKAGGPHYLQRLCVERTLSINTTAVGGNARLVSLLEED